MHVCDHMVFCGTDSGGRRPATDAALVVDEVVDGTDDRLAGDVN